MSHLPNFVISIFLPICVYFVIKNYTCNYPVFNRLLSSFNVICQSIPALVPYFPNFNSTTPQFIFILSCDCTPLTNFINPPLLPTPTRMYVHISL